MCLLLQVNHHFHLNNTVFTEMEHPRFGSIMSVNTQVPVKCGNELFAFYGYGEESRDDHEWYSEQFDQLEKMKEKERKKKKKQKKSA